MEEEDRWTMSDSDHSELLLELERLRKFVRLIEFCVRKYPTMWFGSFPKLRYELERRMDDE